jgi:hypothetical protein
MPLPRLAMGVGFALALFPLSAAAGEGPDGGKLPGSSPASTEALRKAGSGGLPPGHPDPNGGVVPAGPLPPGERDDEEEDDDDNPLPPGHPSVPSGDEGKAKPADPSVFSPPPDTEIDAPELPPGTIVVELRDAENKPLPRNDLTIGILHQSVAKGESREHKSATTDDRGLARMDGLETASGVAYRVTVAREGATFAALPFQLSVQRGKHVTLHVYAVTHNLLDALVVLQGGLFAEVKDDRVQIEQVFTVFNLGKVAWVPDDIVIKLPPTFTALSAQQAMSDQGVDSVEKVGGRLRGTFAPGKHDVQFRWQLPYSGEKDVDFEVGLPPHVAFMRVMVGGTRGVRLSVDGFPNAQSKADTQGARVLVTEKQARRNEPIDSIHTKIDGLPTPGPGRFVATALAGFGVIMGLVLARGGKPSRTGNARALRSRLLAELLSLEKAHAAGDIGPKTYARARRELIDAIALTLDPNQGDPNG